MTTTIGSLDLNAFSDLYSDSNQYFWFESNASATYGAGAHVTLVPDTSFISNPTGQNILMNTDGFSIRNGLLPMMTLDNDSLNFNVINTLSGTYTNTASFRADGATIGIVDDVCMNVNKSSITMVNKGVFEAFRLGFTDNSNADIDQIVTELPTIEYETKSVDLIAPIDYSFGAVEVSIYIKYGTNSSHSIVNHYTADGTKTFSSSPIPLGIKWDVTINSNVIVITCISEPTQSFNSLYMLITYKGESADPSLCIGYGNSVVPKSTCIGSSNMVKSPYGFAVGRNNYISDNGTSGGAAIGNNNEATGNIAIAFGYNAKASGNISYAEGNETEASGQVSHAEGYKSVAGGLHSHAQNFYTRAMSKHQTALGKYNVEDNANTYVVIIGNGTSSARSNALTVDWNGGIQMYLDSDGTSSSAATSGDDMELFNAIYNLGWYSDVIV